ncbi:MAG: hypothetical protein QM743_06625 [Chitinophagaceae bacterium]
MPELQYTLIGDGSSDKALMRIIEWLLNDLYHRLPVKGSFADFRDLRNPPAKGDIEGQIRHALYYYPCDILFYHRDAESTDTGIVERRKQEIYTNINHTIAPEKVVCIVPVVMTEAWLLLDEEAIKKASGNRNFAGPLNLPAVQGLEQHRDPKERLFEFLKAASGLKGRNLAKFNIHKAVHDVADYISDFSLLRQLNSFQDFEASVTHAIDLYLETT